MMNRRTTVLLRRLALIVAPAVVVLTAAASAPADVTRSSSVLAAPFATPAPSFAGATNYATGLGADSVVIADLNGDGRAGPRDRERRSPRPASVDSASVLLNRGDGSFRPANDYATGSTPPSHRDRRPERRRQARLGDREQRGSHRLCIYEQGRRQLPGQARLRNRRHPRLGRDRRPERGRQAGAGDRERRREHASPCCSTGATALSRARRVLRNRVGAPISVAIGDLNGDGKPELATANYDANTVSVLVEQGRRQLPGQARLRNRTRPPLGRDRGPERGRQAGPCDREFVVAGATLRGEQRLRAPRTQATAASGPSATTEPDVSLSG